MTASINAAGGNRWPLESPRARRGFALRFVAVTAVLFGVYTFPYRELGWSEAWFEQYLALYARAAGALLTVFEASGVVQVRGAVIGGRFPIEIVKNCDAIEINVLFASAVLALPASLRQRLLGLLVGLAVLVGLNLARICTLYFIGVYAPQHFETIHIEVWPLALVVTTAIMFLLYASWAQRART